MKKTKILSILGVCLAMGITACGGSNNPSDQPADSGNSSQQPSNPSSDASSTPKHEHKWDDGKVTTEPGCETEGVKTYTCTAEGCDVKTKTEAIPALGHQWGEATAVAADGDGVAYNKFTCGRTGCGAVKYEIALKDIAVASGKALSSSPDPFIKLSASSSFSFNFNSDAYGTGKLYLRATMDHWEDNNGNYDRTLFTGKDGSSVVEHDYPNLKVQINGVALTVTNTKTMQQMLPEIDAEHPVTQDSWSPAGDIEYGSDLVVGKGLNEVIYERVSSFNPAVSHLVLVFKPQAHEQHTLGEAIDSKAATCEEAGYSIKQCSVCKAKVKEEIPAKGHEWENPVEIAADSEKGTSFMKKYTCKNCDKVKYEVPLFVAGEGDALVKNFTLDGEEKAFQPTGSIKLGSNGNKNYYFKVEFSKLVAGMAYQAGSMDQYTKINDDGSASAGANHNRTYSDGGAGEHGVNFKFEINGVDVDPSPYKSIALSKWLGEEYRTFPKDDAGNLEYWSLAKDCPIGEFAVEAGVVMVKYTRLGSYNLANENFSFVVNEYVHTHTPDAVWHSDDEGHWHECSDANCPIKGVKLDYAAHTLEADTAETDTDSTCAVHGIEHKKCSICEKKLAIEKPLADHVWVEGTAAKNSDDKDVTPLECSNCHKVGAKMAINAFSSCTDTAITSSTTDIKMANGSSITYKIVVSKAGTYRLDIFGKYSSGNSGQSLATAPYTVSVNGVDAPVSAGTYKELGMSSSSAKQFILVPTLSLNEGENEIVISQGNGGYRLTFSNSVIAYEK